MQIANPLYDTVFKYLLDDEPVAELFLSALLEKEVKILGYNSPEMLRNREQSETQSEQTKQKDLPFYSVLRLDFSARIQHKGGRIETILIEVQKASNASDLMRFRRYLGLQLQSKQNAIKDKNGILQPLRIYPIYFLAEGLPDIKGHGAVKVERTCYDAFTGERLEVKDNFIEKLTHDSLIICANELRGEHSTGLQKLLSIFNLAAQFKYEHFLIIDEDDYATEYRPIIRRLQKAAEMAEVRRYMDDEDDYLTQLVSAERRGDEATALANTLQKQNNEFLIQIRTERKQAEQEKQQAEREKQQVEQEKEHILAKSIHFGIKNGFSDTEIADNFGIAIEIVARVRAIV